MAAVSLASLTKDLGKQSLNPSPHQRDPCQPPLSRSSYPQGGLCCPRWLAVIPLYQQRGPCLDFHSKVSTSCDKWSQSWSSHCTWPGNGWGAAGEPRITPTHIGHWNHLQHNECLPVLTSERVTVPISHPQAQVDPTEQPPVQVDTEGSDNRKSAWMH